MAFIVPLDMPTTCIECPFLSRPEYIPDEPNIRNTYVKVCGCTIAPSDVEDNYANTTILGMTRFKWRPLKEIKEENKDDES